MRRPLTLLLLYVLAVPAATAQAATVEIQDGTLRYTAAAGERNHPTFHHRAEDELVVYDPDFERQSVIAGPGCVQDGANTAICPRAAVTRAEFALGDRARRSLVPDSLMLTGDVPVPVAAGAAEGSGARVAYIELRALALSLDGMANDGPAARGDNLGPGIAAVNGGDGSDSIVGNAAPNAIYGNHGSDWVNGAGGDDEITLASFNDVGADAVGLDSEGQEDYVLCGPGRDVVYFDDSDLIESDCELQVLVHDRGYTYNGTRGADRIIADRGPATVVGFGGDDRLGATRFAGGVVLRGESGDDRLAGNTAADTLTGGTGSDHLAGAEGPDRLSGGSGGDSIDSRDRSADRVSCGSGRDTVAADRRDRVARDCERVRRR